MIYGGSSPLVFVPNDEAFASMGHFLLLVDGQHSWFVLVEAKSALLLVGRDDAWQR
jgi:hypothetical protein